MENYEAMIRKQLLGRMLRPEAGSMSQWGRPMLSSMGWELGFPEGDVHRDRSYRVYLTLDEGRRIVDAELRVEGDLISPCSGYYPEMLDEFDYGMILSWVLASTI